MLAEGIVALSLMRPLLSPRDELHRPNAIEALELVCSVAGDRRWVTDRWHRVFSVDAYCHTLNDIFIRRYLRGTIHEFQAR